MITIIFNKINIKCLTERIIDSIKSPFVLLRTFCWALVFKKIQPAWLKHKLTTDKEVECASISRTVFSSFLALFIPLGLFLWHSEHPWLPEPEVLVVTLCSMGLVGVLGLCLNYRKKGLWSQWGYGSLKCKDLEDLVRWMGKDSVVEETVNEWIKSGSTTIRHHDFMVLKIAFLRSWLNFKKTNNKN